MVTTINEIKKFPNRQAATTTAQPNRVLGEISPYPTVVIVTIVHHMLSVRLNIY